MPSTSYAQTSFLGGEWSQSMQGRFDRPDYRTGMNRALNCMPIASGMSVRRPGTRYAGHTRNGQAGRLVKFDFQQSDPYTMEFTDGKLRFFSGSDLVTDSTSTVTSISTANPAVVTTATPHGWATADQVRFGASRAVPTVLHNRQILITVLTPTTFSIADPTTGAGINGAGLTAIGPLATVARIREITTPFLVTSLPGIRSVQQQTTAFLLSGSVMPQVLTATLQSAGPPTFALTPSTFQDGPFGDPIAGGTLLTVTGQSGVISATASFPVWSAVVTYALGDYVTQGTISYISTSGGNLNFSPSTNPSRWTPASSQATIGPNGFQATDIGRQIRLLSEPADWVVTTAYTVGQTVKYADVYWYASGASTGRRPGTDLASWTISTTAARWTWGRIVALSNFISGVLAGSTNFGDLTSGGGLAVAFDGSNTTGNNATGVASSILNNTTIPTPFTFTRYIGKNYTGATPQTISSVTVSGWKNGLTTIPIVQASIFPVATTLNLRAKQTPPTSASDGVLLGSSSAAFSRTTETIQSSDTTTAWGYVWVEIIASAASIDSANFIQIRPAEVTFYAPPSGSSGIDIEILGGSLLYALPIRTWRLGLYSDTTGWPTCGTYHEGRLWLAGAQGNRIDASVSNKTQVFSPTSPEGTVADSNGLSYVFNSGDVNALFWIESDQQGILCGSSAGEWLVQANTNNVPLTPTNMQAHRVTTIGGANIAPVRADHTLIFVQKFLRKAVEFFSDISYGRFSSTDITDKFRHLTIGNIAEIVYQPELSPVVWMRRADGGLIGCTYRREAMSTSQPPMFAGGHQHALGSGRLVESIAIGPSAKGLLSTLTMITNDAATGVRHVEILTDIPDETSALQNQWYLDDAVIPTCYITTFATCTFHGLWHLNGKTVSVFAGGLDCGDYVVSNGSVVVPFGDGVAAGTGQGLFTQDFVASFTAMPCVVGFTYTSQGQMVRPAIQAEAGTAAGPAFGKVRRSHQYGVMLVNSKAPQVGVDFASLRTAQLRTLGGREIDPRSTYTGMHVDTLDDDYTLDSMLAWQMTRPLPCNIAAFGAYLSTQDK